MAEAKATREIFAKAKVVAATDNLDALLDKFSYWKAIRVCAWIRRFFFNFRTRKISRATGPLTTQELNLVKLLWRRTSRKEPEKTNIIKRTCCNQSISLTQTVYWSAEA